MPEIKALHVVSFSSEDKVHKAENLLKPETYRKWKCATPGEKQASVVLQLEKASRFHSVEIGNEGSAFVEVLVSRSSDPNREFQVLLVSSSFMTPMESKQNTNLNRVRVFGSEKLSQTVAKEKWDQVKIVCNQPFNKSTQYGIAFIRFHSPSAENNEPASNTTQATLNLGAFKLKVEEEEGGTDISVGSWFTKRASLSQESAESNANSGSKTLAAAVAEQVENKVRKHTSPKFSTSTISIQTEKRSPSITNGTSPQTTSKIRSPATVTAQREQHRRDSKTSEASTSSHGSSNKSAKEHKNNADKEKSAKKPLSDILKGVVFVLSGFQNPLRTEIRDKAIEMGARYKSDWDKSCTHLICAFINTPKYNQVMSVGGRIVKKEWIYDCYKWKKQFPWRQFKLGSYADNSSTEDVSNDDEEYVPPAKKKNLTKSSESKARINTSFSDDDENDPDYDASTDVDIESEDEDTDDILERVRAAPGESQKKKVKNNSKRKEDKSSKENAMSKQADMNTSTKQEDMTTHEDVVNLPLPELPDLFKKRHFFLYGDFPEEERRTLVRYIIGFNGIIEDYMSDEVKYVITCSDWDEKFDEAVSENDNLIFVRSKWIYQCADKKKMIPHQHFIVVPS